MAAVGGRVKGVQQNCEPCLKKDIKHTAEVFCSSCNEFQCDECLSSHAVFSFMKDHTLKTVSEAVTQCDTDDKNTEDVDMNGLDICEKHQTPFEFYCKKNKALACSSCAIFDHKKCVKVVDLVTVAKGNKCIELRDKLQSAILTTKQVVENIEEAVTYVNSRPQPIHEKLKLFKQTVDELFDDFAKKLTKDTEGYRNAATSAWDRKNIECEGKIKTMEVSLETMDTISTKGTLSQQFIVAHCMQETIPKEVKKAESLRAEVRGLNVSCSFNAKLDALKSSMLSAMKPGDFEISYIIPMKTKLKLIASTDVMQMRDDVEEPLYTDLDFLPDGRLLAVDNKNGNCLIYDQNLRQKSVYKLPFPTPRGLVAVTDEELAITTGGSESVLAFLRVTKSKEMTLIRKFMLKAQYSSISMKDDDNFAVCAVDHHPPVRMLSMTGEEKDFDTKFPQKNYPIGTSYCTYIRGKDKVVLTDQDADTVFIYDVKTHEKVVIKDKLIKAPNGVAVGPYDRVFVGSRSTSSSLVEITPSGRVLSSHQVDMQSPCYVAVSKDGKRLAVSNADTGDTRLRLYEIQYR